MKLLCFGLMNIAYWLALGFGIEYIYNHLPRKTAMRFFNPDRFLFSVGAREARRCRRLGINRWKPLLPQCNGDFDKSNLGAAEPRHLRLFIFHTCKAEAIHWTVGILGFSSILLSYLEPIPSEHFRHYFFMSLAVFIGNAPFAIIQRYNRYRLVRLLSRLTASERNLTAETV